MSKKTVSKNSYLFGFKSSSHDSKIVLMNVPWEVTTSYGGGASLGPRAIYEASPQIDLFDLEIGEPYKVGFYLKPEDPFFMKTNQQLKKMAQKIIKANEAAAAEDDDGQPGDPTKHNKALRDTLQKVNAGCEEMVSRVYNETKKVLADNKIPGLIGGDHSTPLGAIKAISEKYDGEIGVLHIDAHADLRLAYQGFTHSHASIMRNVSKLKVRPKRLVQVAIRDFCKEEYDFIEDNSSFVTTFFDLQLKQAIHGGENWRSVCDRIVAQLPDKVYVSFDIDGLSPEYCPNTGTPVPGGISFDQALTLLTALGKSGKTIVGFDLNEVVPGKDEWDGNVGARLLYKLCGWAASTNDLI